MSGLTPDQIEFTNAFNQHRMLLAGFANCANAAELHVIRDGLYLALARDLCPAKYEPIQQKIVMSEGVAEATGTESGVAKMVHVARESSEWPALVAAVLAKATAVGSDLEGIWMTLEQGRLNWLKAASGAHGIKMTLRNQLKKDNAMESAGDVSDAKMIWIYSLCLNIESLSAAALAWAKLVQLPDPTKPLVGYKPELWDARKDEWRPLDSGAQAAAEAGGSNIKEAWNAE